MLTYANVVSALCGDAATDFTSMKQSSISNTNASGKQHASNMTDGTEVCFKSTVAKSLQSIFMLRKVTRSPKYTDGVNKSHTDRAKMAE